MAYIKYKELTHYFNFHKELDINALPNYVKDYIEDGEEILTAYSTTRDKFIMTNYKIILFDVRGILGKSKTIHFFPYSTMSSTAIEFKPKRIAILISMDSGYQLRINFVKMLASDKTKMRQIYMNMIKRISLSRDDK